jgi:DNA-binding winged helix-turn-helix (wHTH) protein/Tfp pilus assembly protein PilF
MPENNLLEDVNRAARRICFDVFEVDFAERELRKSGERLRLQRQPFRILELLLQKPGLLVTREELARHLWPGLHVCFDRGLNTAVNALRQILGDSFRTPRFIETRPGLGYRFIAPTQELSAPSQNETSKLAQPIKPERENRKKYTANFEAYQDYLKGRYFLSKAHAESILKAIAHFEAAVAQDRNCAPAYAGLSDAYCDLALLGLSSIDNGAKAKTLAASALELDPELAEAHVAQAHVSLLFGFDWNGAYDACTRALELAPDHADAHRAFAMLLSAIGNHEQALRTVRHARVLDPLSLPVNTDLAWHLFLALDFEAAAEHCWKVLTMETTFSPAQYTLGLAYEQMDMPQEAITELRNSDAGLGCHEAALGALGHAYAVAGMRQQALEALTELEAISARKHTSPYWRALIYLGLGDSASALALMNEAHQARDVALLWIGVDPRLAGLRSDARFRRILQEMNLLTGAHSAAFA